MQSVMTADEIMSCEDIQNYLHISRESARRIMRLPDFPCLQVGVKALGAVTLAPHEIAYEMRARAPPFGVVRDLKSAEPVGGADRGGGGREHGPGLVQGQPGNVDVVPAHCIPRAGTTIGVAGGVDTDVVGGPQLAITDDG